MGNTDYSQYLKIDELLTLQVPLTEGVPDELLFIVVHQSYELWFKVIIDELRTARTALLAAMPWQAVPALRRVVAVEDLLLVHLRILESMSPEAFLAFRDPLNPASGFQSYQFRALEFLSGGGQPALLHFEVFTDAQREWLTKVHGEVTVWAAFQHALRRELGQNEGDLVTAARALYHNHAAAVPAALHAVAELLMDHDERLAMWRHQHLLMAGRQIGRRPGTGGSEGMAYLDTTLGQRLYPELWEVRSVL